MELVIEKRTTNRRLVLSSLIVLKFSGSVKRYITYSASFAYSPGYGYEASDFAYHTPDNKIPMMWVHDDKVMVEIDNLGPQQRDSQDVARVAVG